MQRIGRRATQDGSTGVENRAEPRRAAHTASWDGECADAACGIKSSPESEEGAEREGEEDAVLRAHFSGFEDTHPVRYHPGPAFRSVDTAHGGAGAAAGLAEAGVAVDRVCEVCAEGRVFELVVEQFAFVGERDLGAEVVERFYLQAG